MCPDTELLSAWMDGEVPPPWRDRISAHVDGCEACAKRVSAWKGLSGLLRSSGSFDEAAVVGRIRSRLDDRLGRSQGVEVGPRSGKLGLFRNLAGKVSLSFPAAAAAALALLLAGGFSGGLLAGSSGLARGERTANANLASASSSNMDSLVRYLEAQNAQVSVTIQLPQNASFPASGEPMIVKTPPVETVSWPPASSGSGFSASGQGTQGK